MTETLKKWILLSFISLLIVSLLGVLLRYKIGFSFPYLDQKNLHHAHSHFAFAGWISQTLYVLLIHTLGNSISKRRFDSYNILLGANWITAMGMLIAFAIQGYGLYSSFFSSFSIILSFVFAVMFWRDLKFNSNLVAGQFFKYSLAFLVISSLGAIWITIMMATKTLKQHNYLASEYWYLHFQYNGWFFFACMGLLFNHFGKLHDYFSTNRLTLKLLAFSCIPAYGLSVLWMHLPLWVEIGIAIAAAAQAAGWVLLLYNVHKSQVLERDNIADYIKWLLLIIAIAGTIKFSLQLGSTIPSVSKLAFGFRPIVIAYLHLVLLAFISLLIISYSFLEGLAERNRTAFAGIVIFVTGVFINELLLAIQGIASFSYKLISHINTLLFGASLLLASGATILMISQLPNSKKKNDFSAL